MSHKRKVIFICHHNSARSQMAEGFLKTFYPEEYEVFSAGIEPTYVNPYAVKVMNEIGIDISNHRSKSVYEFTNENIDIAVTVCDSAKENCPFFPARKIVHKSFKDPASFEGTEEEKLELFREVRDEIKDWIINFFGKRK